MKRRNPRLLVFTCAVLALLVVPAVATAAGPGLGGAVHQGDNAWSLTGWLGQLGSSFWSILTYDASKQGEEIEKLGQQLDPNGRSQFDRTWTDGGEPPEADGG
jgi:hypothetical protein